MMTLVMLTMMLVLVVMVMMRMPLIKTNMSVMVVLMILMVLMPSLVPAQGPCNPGKAPGLVGGPHVGPGPADPRGRGGLQNLFPGSTAVQGT